MCAHAQEPFLNQLEQAHDPEPAKARSRLRADAADPSRCQELRLDYRGPNHSEGNIFIWAPKQKLLMLVDVIFPGWVPSTRLAVLSSWTYRF